MSERQTRETVLTFLDNLRKSGKINMFGAAPVVQEMFGFNTATARAYVVIWMETFSERHPNQ